MTFLSAIPVASSARAGQPVAAALEDRGPRRVGYLLAVAVATMPILTPAGPGNTALADVTIAATIGVTVMWLHRHGGKVVVPYSFGIGLLMIAGSVAALHVLSRLSGLAIFQDLFSLLWGAVIANAVRQRVGLLRVFLGAWCWSGLAWAFVMVFGKLAGLDAVAGISAKDGGRAALTFNDPNLAGNYFLCVLFVLLASRVIRRRWIRVTGVVLLITAIVFTGSNGAGIGITVGLAFAIVARLGAGRGPIPAIAAICLMACVAGVGGGYLDLSALRQKAANSIQLLQDSIGRSGESGNEREILLVEGMRLFREGDLIGVGPGRTRDTLADQAAPYVKEAHNDYLATLVERGALGGLGLIALIAAIAVRLGRVSLRPLPPDVAALVPRPEMLLGLGAAFLVAGFFYEVLHFRHLWAFLGLVAALDPGVRRRWTR